MISAFSCRRDLKQSHSMRTNRRPIAIMRRSCSDSPVTASQLDAVFGSDRARYHCYQRSLRKEIGAGEFGRTASHFDARLVAVSRMDDDLCDLLAAVDRAATERAGEVFNRGEVARVTMLGCSATIFAGGARTASSAWAPSRPHRSSGSRERASSSEIVPRAIWSRIRSISRLV